MVKVQVAKPEKEVKEAAKLIETFLEKNQLSTNLTIYLDYQLKECGCYYYYEEVGEKKVNPPKIYVNPILCIKSQNKKKVAASYGYFDDFSVGGVILHEFAHYIDRRLKLESKFESSLVINKNCDTKMEQLAELFRLYLTNPYLLWLVSESDFNFFKENVFSVTPASKERFLFLWSTWPKKVKLHCKKHWGIYVDRGDVVQIEKT